MPVKITEQEACYRDNQNGWIRLEPYIGMRVKHKYRCPHCDNICLIAPGQIWRNDKKKQLSCGCLVLYTNRPNKYLQQRFNMLTVVGRGEKKVTKSGACTYYFKCRCDCGNICYSDICSLKNGTKWNCGCIIRRPTSKSVGKKYGRLTVKGWGRSYYTKGGYKISLVNCICDCGKTVEVRQCDLTSGRTQSCGCLFNEVKRELKKSLVGQRFGKLLVIEREVDKPKEYGNVSYKVLCDCGQEQIVTSSNLSSGLQRSCGNCKLFRNGVQTSWPALRLHDMIGNGKHNYDTGIKQNIHNINVDIALVEDKIAIEYDGLFYHKNNELYDREQTIKLIKGGWKVLRIRSYKNLPTKHELNIMLQVLREGKQKVITFTC